MSIRTAIPKDIPCIVQLTNSAFKVDSYFKKPEFSQRTSSSFVLGILSHPKPVKETFLVYIDPTDTLVGSIHVSWDVQLKTGHFGMLSVSSSARKGGIGSSLVQAAEKYCLDRVGSPCTMGMPVIDSRTDLFPFYKRKEYSHVSTVPFVCPEIVKDGISVEMFMFEKVLE